MNEKLTTFLKFIGGQGTILVRSNDEFKKFLNMLREHAVEGILKPKARSYMYWREIALLNGHNPGVMCFEYQPGKGLSIYHDMETPTNWYGERPMLL